MDDDEYYLKATEEWDQGSPKASVHAKAMALAEGDIEKAKYRYVKFRVQQLSKKAEDAVDIEAAKNIVIQPQTPAKKLEDTKDSEPSEEKIIKTKSKDSELRSKGYLTTSEISERYSLSTYEIWKLIEEHGVINIKGDLDYYVRDVPYFEQAAVRKPNPPTNNSSIMDYAQGFKRFPFTGTTFGLLSLVYWGVLTLGAFIFGFLGTNKVSEYAGSDGILIGASVLTGLMTYHSYKVVRRTSRYYMGVCISSLIWALLNLGVVRNEYSESSLSLGRLIKSDPGIAFNFTAGLIILILFFVGLMGAQNYNKYIGKV